MIIRRKHNSRFTIVPNAIFEDARLSIEAKGVLGYLLSRPPDWEVRHAQLRAELGVGRRWLERIMQELIAASYLERDNDQGRDENNRFTTLNYVVKDVPGEPAPAIAVVHTAHRRRPMRGMYNGNKKEESKTDSTNPLPKPLPAAQAGNQQASRDKYSEMGQHALSNGMHAVWEGSKPFVAWVKFRGLDGMPLFDTAVINGVLRRLVWMQSLYPPTHAPSRDPTDGAPCH